MIYTRRPERRFIVGIDLESAFIQISYLNARRFPAESEPRTFSFVAGEEAFNLPAAAYFQRDQDDPAEASGGAGGDPAGKRGLSVSLQTSGGWLFGYDAVRAAAAAGEKTVTDIVSSAVSGRTVSCMGESADAFFLLTGLMKHCLTLLSAEVPTQEIEAACFSVPRTGREISDIIRRAAAAAGFPEGKISCEEHLRSFYSYILMQDEEQKRHSVLLADGWKEEKIILTRLSFNRKTKPIVCFPHSRAVSMPVQVQTAAEDVRTPGGAEGDADAPVRGGAEGDADAPVHGEAEGDADAPVHGGAEGDADAPVHGGAEGDADAPDSSNEELHAHGRAEKNRLAHRKDEILTRALKEILGEEEVSAVYLTGKAFDGSWMRTSLDLICSGRRAFQGDNLYSKGAVCSLMAGAGMTDKAGRFFFLGTDALRCNIGVYCEQKHRKIYRALLDAGTDWTQAEAELEFMLADDPELVLQLSPVDGREPGRIAVMLENMPDRLLGTGRLRMRLGMSAADRLHISVEDLGFGEIFPSSGMRWEQDVDIG